MKLKNVIKKILTTSGIYHIYIFFSSQKKKKKLMIKFREELTAFNLTQENTTIRFKTDYQILPLLDDKTNVTPIEPHYTYHPAWAARVLAQTLPEKHVDISSILHFSTLISAFIPTEFYDFRPAEVKLSNFVSKHADLTNLFFESNSIDSLSCMHTVEHIGLGRYGDPIDYNGDIKAISELKRVLAPGGTLIFVVPIGKPKIVFNAHRIYSYIQVMSYFSEFELIEFSIIPDNFKNGIITHASELLSDDQDWGCGCFWFKKPKN